jgi:transcriptional regulator with XRE-family HTH domain
MGGSPVDVSLVIRQRLEELGLEQRDLARAAQVTESYISQLMTQKKLPPAPERTDMYDKMGKLLKLPSGKLAKLAHLQRREQLKKKLGDPPSPLFKEVRELILGKCNPDKQTEIRAIFEKQPFGELERFITQKLLDVVKGLAKQELENEPWLRRVARLSHQSYEQMRVIVLEFLDTNIFTLSSENCVSFFNPLIESWDVDLATFGMEIVLNRRMAPGHLKKFEFVEREPGKPLDEEPGFKEFLRDTSLSDGATGEEIEFLRKLRFKKKRPTPLYYYRALQNLRDPLHFR